MFYEVEEEEAKEAAVALKDSISMSYHIEEQLDMNQKTKLRGRARQKKRTFFISLYFVLIGK